MKKLRVDDYLCNHGICADRDEALRLIMAGKVRRNPDSVIAKASELVPFDAALLVDSADSFASRGAGKLEPSLMKHLPDLTGLKAIDIGSSTGGFTDLMLRRNAEKVYAVDCGKGLLHAKLRNDPRVVCLEGTNARTLDRSIIPEEIDVMTMDVSFISTTKILPAADVIMAPGAWAFILVKPQFEADRKDVPPGGVVVDETVRAACVEKVKRFAVERLAWNFLEVSPSPVKGPKGNQEYIAVFRKSAASAESPSR